MNLAVDGDNRPALPVADGSALSGVERAQIDQLLEPGVAVWVWSHHDKEWISAEVDNINLLDDRCLFEVRCERSVESDFLEGYGMSLHSGFHGADWFIKESDTPPVDHPLAPFPELEYGRWIRADVQTGPAWGQIASINTVTNEFALQVANNFGISPEFMAVGREHFDFHEILEMEVLPKEITGAPIGPGDVVVLPAQNVLGKAAYRLAGYDELHEAVLLRSVSMLSKGDLTAIDVRELQQKGEVFLAAEMVEVMRSFPELALDGEKRVIFEHEGEIFEGGISGNREKESLPAFLEVLVRKSNEEMAERGDEWQPDEFHRYQVPVECLREISKG